MQPRPPPALSWRLHSLPTGASPPRWEWRAGEGERLGFGAPGQGPLRLFTVCTASCPGARRRPRVCVLPDRLWVSGSMLGNPGQEPGEGVCVSVPRCHPSTGVSLWDRVHPRPAFRWSASVHPGFAPLLRERRAPAGPRFGGWGCGQAVSCCAPGRPEHCSEGPCPGRRPGCVFHALRGPRGPPALCAPVGGLPVAGVSASSFWPAGPPLRPREMCPPRGPRCGRTPSE